MFDLEKNEKYILIFLLIAFLIGISIKYYQERNKTVDVKIKSFAFEPSGAAPIKININEADETTLAMLEGVGPSLAKRIADYRSTNGRFGSIEELKKVKGIGEKLFSRIKDEVSTE